MTAMMLFSVFMVMIAGGGSLVDQYLGWPALAGALLVAIPAVALAWLGIRHLYIAIAAFVPLMLAMALFLGIDALWQHEGGYAPMESFALAQTNRAANHWLVAAALYISYNVAAIAPLLAMLGGQAATHRTAIMGSTVGGLLVGGLIIVMTTTLFVRLGAVAIFPMPMLALAQDISPAVGAVMALTIFGMTLGTALACLYPLLSRLSAPGSIRFRAYAVAAGLLGLLGSTQGFVPLLSFIYPLFGVLGMVLTGAIFLAWIRARLAQLALPKN